MTPGRSTLGSAAPMSSTPTGYCAATQAAARNSTAALAASGFRWRRVARRWRKVITVDMAGEEASNKNQVGPAREQPPS